MDIDTLRAKWDAFADVFERNYERSTVQLARTLAANARLDTATSILELGCGAGGGTVEALRFAAEDARYVALDLSPEMLRRARQRLPDRVETCAADAARLPFEDDAFDRIIANLSLMIVPDTDGVISEIRRVLRPHGRLVASIWGRPERSPMMTTVAAVAKSLGLPLEPPPRSNFHLTESFRVRLLAAGFDTVVQGLQDMAIDVESGTEFVEGFLLQHPGWQPWLEGLSPEDHARVLVAVAEAVDVHLAEGRLLALEGSYTIAF